MCKMIQVIYNPKKMRLDSIIGITTARNLKKDIDEFQEKNPEFKLGMVVGDKPE